MGIESTTTIAGLDSTWPLGSDPIAQGDNHVRLLKAVLKNIFPGVGGNGFATPITAKEAEINYLVGVTSGIQSQLNLKAPLANPTFTGTPLAPTAAVDTNTTQIATTAFVINQAYAKLASPAFSGTPTVPSAALNNDSSLIASTHFVQQELNSRPATQAEMEAAASGGKYATPANIIYHPLVPKAIAKINSAGTLLYAIGVVASASKVGTGRVQLNFSAPFSSANSMHFSVQAYETDGTSVRDCKVMSYNTGSAIFSCDNAATTYVDPDEWHIIVWGDL